MNNYINANTYNILYSSIEISRRLSVIAEKINNDYEGRIIDVVCLSNSAMFFTSDLLRLLRVEVKLHLVSFTSYSIPKNSGEVRVLLDLADPIDGRHVLVIEGMVISGRTPLYLLKLLRSRNPATIELCCVGSKPDELAVDLSIKYRLFEFQKEWVAGYGIGNGPEKVSADLINLKS